MTPRSRLRGSLKSATLVLWLGLLPLAFAPALSAAPQLLPIVANAPRIPLHSRGTSGTSAGWSSSNWSGYALSSSNSGAYSSIDGSWIVPAVVSTQGQTYSSSWIGIDGFNNSDLIQTGTEQDASKKGTTYYAWWEILPAAETTISSMTIHPGDQMHASIRNNGNGTWTITLADQTSGQTFTTTQSYSGPATSAEWIEEAPTIGGHVATLADYGTTTFDPGTVNGQNPGLVTNDSGVMIQKSQQVSTPSLPDSDTDGFNMGYGPSAPSAPAS